MIPIMISPPQPTHCSHIHSTQKLAWRRFCPTHPRRRESCQLWLTVLTSARLKNSPGVASAPLAAPTHCTWSLGPLTALSLPQRQQRHRLDAPVPQERQLLLLTDLLTDLLLGLRGSTRSIRSTKVTHICQHPRLGADRSTIRKHPECIRSSSSAGRQDPYESCARGGGVNSSSSIPRRSACSEAHEIDILALGLRDPYGGTESTLDVT